MVETCLGRQALVRLLPPAGNCDDNHAAPECRTETTSRFIAIQFGHTNIQEHDFGAERKGYLDSCFSVICRANIVTSVLEVHSEQDRRILVVICDDDSELPLKTTTIFCTAGTRESRRLH